MTMHDRECGGGRNCENKVRGGGTHDYMEVETVETIIGKLEGQLKNCEKERDWFKRRHCDETMRNRSGRSGGERGLKEM